MSILLITLLILSGISILAMLVLLIAAIIVGNEWGKWN
jgi:hypothetical protein